MSAVVVISPEELAAIIEAAVKRALETRGSAAPAEWLDAKRAAELLGVHQRTVMRLAKNGELPSSRIGRLLRFRREHVLALMNTR